ncbi:hypothetical protein ACXYMU_15765 [Pontibacter sp. CAU 1760]
MFTHQDSISGGNAHHKKSSSAFFKQPAIPQSSLLSQVRGLAPLKEVTNSWQRHQGNHNHTGINASQRIRWLYSEARNTHTHTLYTVATIPRLRNINRPIFAASGIFAFLMSSGEATLPVSTAKKTAFRTVNPLFMLYQIFLSPKVMFADMKLIKFSYFLSKAASFAALFSYYTYMIRLFTLLSALCSLHQK